MNTDLDSKLRVHAIYVIIEDGRCAYFKEFSELAPSPHLVSAMLTAMQVFVKEVVGTNFSEVTAGPFTFISEKAGPFSVVLVSGKSKTVTEKAKYLVLRFMRKYQGIIEDWNGEMYDFHDFDQDVEEVFGMVDVLRSDPKVPLDALALIELSPELQAIAQLALRKIELTTKMTAKALDMPEFAIDHKLKRMFELGYFGRYAYKGDYVYFLN